jgi:hypothetical protein
MDPDLGLAIARAYKLNVRSFELIEKNRDLLACKFPGLRNNKELYQCYQKFGKALWAEATDYASENVILPDPNKDSFSRVKIPRPEPNALHFIATLNGAEKIKQLSDIGALVAKWFIEDLAYYVVNDYHENKDDPENAQFEPLWGLVPEVEDMHTMSGYDEALVRKLNNRLAEGGN